ncbi:hypothetical protein, partial [Bacillus pumilus]|uniref:hypothetical protein n=1 Tax=Bacillus pumilus TaxID=1408 RepID=UPI001C9305D4
SSNKQQSQFNPFTHPSYQTTHPSSSHNSTHNLFILSFSFILNPNSSSSHTKHHQPIFPSHKSTTSHLNTIFHLSHEDTFITTHNLPS